jgi:hypothetical protein
MQLSGILDVMKAIVGRDWWGLPGKNSQKHVKDLYK